MELETIVQDPVESSKRAHTAPEASSAEEKLFHGVNPPIRPTPEPS